MIDMANICDMESCISIVMKLNGYNYKGYLAIIAEAITRQTSISELRCLTFRFTFHLTDCLCND